MSPWGRPPAFDPADHRASASVATQLWYNYDRVLQSFLGELRWDNRPVLVVFASPDRAFAQVGKLLERQEIDVIPLLFSSLERVGPGAFDRSRFVEVNVVYPLLTRTVPVRFVSGRKPRPISLSYQWEVWAHNTFDLDWIYEQLSARVRDNEFYLRVDHPLPVGNRLVRFVLDDNPKDSPIYSDPYKKRSKRRTFTFTAEGWLCYPSELTPVVETIVTEFYESADMVTPGEKLGEIVRPA